MAAGHPRLVFLTLLWTVHSALAASGSGTDVQGSVNGLTKWRDLVAARLCPLVACQQWCDCSRGVRLGSRINLDNNCTIIEEPLDMGKFLMYTDCQDLTDRACFRWKPYRVSSTPSGCQPQTGVLVCFRRFDDEGGNLHYEVILDGTNTRLNVSDMCNETLHDTCNLCTSDATLPTNEQTGSLSPRPPGQRAGTTPYDTNETSTADYDSSGSRSAQLNAFIIGVCVGVGVAVFSFIVICILIIYIRRKLSKDKLPEEHAERPGTSVDGNAYCTIEPPLRGRSHSESRPGFTISRSVPRRTSIDPATPVDKKKSKKKSKKPVTSKNPQNGILGTDQGAAAYTEYYADRTMSCYAGLHTVASDSALMSLDTTRKSAATSFKLAAEYQAPDEVTGKGNSTPFEDQRLKSASSFHSFKMNDGYVNPEEVFGPSPKKLKSVAKVEGADGDSGGISAPRSGSKQYKPKAEESTAAPTPSMWHGLRKGKQKMGGASSCKVPESQSRQCLGSPDGKEGTLYLELVETLNRDKKPVKKTESTPLAIEAENPYAEVGEAGIPPSPALTARTRPRSYSQPMVATLQGYRTYEEIKPVMFNFHAQNSHAIENDNSKASNDRNRQHVEIKKKDETSEHYFELENPGDQESTRQYFQLQKPTSLPLENGKRKKHVLTHENKLFYQQHMDKTATLYQNDKCTTGPPGFKNRYFGKCVCDENNSCPTEGTVPETALYFQLERPGERGSSGSSIQEYMGSTETIFVNEPNKPIEGTLTYYPGGRKRSSTYSLEEQAYDKLNRSARSSRSSSRRNTLNSTVVSSTSSDGAYAVLTPTDESSLLTRGNTRSKGLRKQNKK